MRLKSELANRSKGGRRRRRAGAGGTNVEEDGNEFDLEGERKRLEQEKISIMENSQLVQQEKETLLKVV